MAVLLPEHEKQSMKNIHLRGILFISFFFSLFIMLLGMGRYLAAILFTLSFLCFSVIGVFLDIFVSRHLSSKISRILSGDALGEKIYSACSDRKPGLLLWILITLCFAPTYIALFPGTFGYDAPIQAAQYFGELELTGANPLLHTYLLGIFLSLGEILWKDASAGFALFTLIQGLLTTQVLARSLLFLKKIHTPFTVIAIGFLWVALNPPLHILTFNATKDILFGIFFLHFLLNLLETISDVSAVPSLPDRILVCSCFSRPYLRLLLSGIIMCLMRNAAIYLAALLALIMIFTLRNCKRTIISLCMIFIISRLFSLFFAWGLNIPPGNARENMSVPIQQLAAVCHASAYGTEPANITDQQFNTIRDILPVESWDIFEQDSVDPVKAVFQTEVFSEDSGKYISLYLTIGRQNPRLYIHAFRDLFFPYFNMGKSIRRGLALDETFPGISHLTVSRYGFFPSYYSFLERQLVKKHYFLPMQPGISIYLMVIGIGVCMERKNKKILLCILPIAIYFVGLLLGPIALLRYLFPMMLATPLLFGILFWKDPLPASEQPEP